MLALMTTHERLAKMWAEWNGQRGTATQIARIMSHMTVETLARLLMARGVLRVDA